MESNREELELFWDGILSEDRKQVISVFLSVPRAQQQGCLEHLNRMVNEDGWQEAQRKSARFALDVLNK